LQDNGAARYVTRDQLLSIHEVTDSSATIQTRYDYGPFGAVTKTGSGTDFFGYTGEPVHEASGLLLMQRRACDTGIARWLSEDPIGLKSGPNLYAYVLNDPMRWIDPGRNNPSSSGSLASRSLDATTERQRRRLVGTARQQVQLSREHAPIQQSAMHQEVLSGARRLL
jgi:RHS repeat-associated protein